MSLDPHIMMYFHETWMQWCFGTVTHVTSIISVGSKVVCESYGVIEQVVAVQLCIHLLWCIFMGRGHKVSLVELHVWPQQVWITGHQWSIDLSFCSFCLKWQNYSRGVTHISPTGWGLEVIKVSLVSLRFVTLYNSAT